jgi:putative ABC transport system permease protein
MTISTFILKNAVRNKRRALLSVSSVAISLFLLVTLQVALRELTLPPPSAGAELRVAVRNKISLTNPLPARQRGIIEKIPGVVAVSPFTWFGGKYKHEEGMSFAQFAMDPNRLQSVFGEARMNLEGYEKFKADKDACVLGRITAEKYHLKVGDRMTLESTIYPGSLTFQIAGIYSGTPDDRNMLFRQDYLDESIGTPGYVGMWWLKVKRADDMAPVIKAINVAFQNTSAEVRAESERNFQLGFISMLGNVRTLIGSISTVVVFTLVLVTASTMSMAVRERFRELAILKAIGFRRRELFAFILAESFGLAVAGAILGICGAWLLFMHTMVLAIVFSLAMVTLLVLTVLQAWQRNYVASAMFFLSAPLMAVLVDWVMLHPNVTAMTAGIFVSFEVTPRIMGLAALVAVLLGVVSAVAPSLSVARMSVVNGLKTLD